MQESAPIAKVLHVDDAYRQDPHDFRELREFLRARGFDVHAEGDFSKAPITYRRLGCPYVVILDLLDQDLGTFRETLRGADVARVVEEEHPASPEAPWFVIYTKLPEDDAAVVEARKLEPHPGVVRKTADPLRDATEILSRFPQSLRNRAVTQ